MVRKKCKKLMNDQNFEEGIFMVFFGVLTMLGGLALFLYGMETMGNGLEKLSGGRLERILEKLTSNPIKAVLLGAGVTAVIQSSSATTVMVVGFKLGHHEADAGGRHHHGRQHRNDCYFLAPEPYRN